MRAALLFILLASTPAFAFDEKAAPASEDTGGATSAPAETEKKICKRVAASESRMAAKRVCLTAAEWKKAQADSER